VHFHGRLGGKLRIKMNLKISALSLAFRALFL